MKLLTAFLGSVSLIASAQIEIPIDAPLAQLPKSVSCPEGQVALVADFKADRPEGKIPVFLVSIKLESARKTYNQRQ